MEPCDHQYDCDWNYCVYIYSGSGSMRGSGCCEYNSGRQSCSDIPDRTEFNLSECNSADIAVDISRRSYRNMESCHNQYNSDWNHCVYIYSNNRSMCRSDFSEYYNCKQCCSNLPDRAQFNLPECDGSSIACNFQ